MKELEPSPVDWLSSTVGALKRRFFGTGGLPWVGFVFAVVGVVFFVLILLSPGGWQWWMDVKAVHAQEQNGIVSYSYQGRNYTIDDVGSLRTGPRLVYLIPSNPADGALKVRANQIFDWSITAGPLLIALAFVGAGFVHKSRGRRQLEEARSSSGGSFGLGLDEDTLRRLLAQQRDGGQRPRPPPEASEDTPQS
jgi:hypothetical protein